MKYLAEGFLVVGLLMMGYGIGRATASNAKPATSRQLLEKAVALCANVPELDAQRLYCVAAHMEQECELDQLDLRLCGEVKK